MCEYMRTQPSKVVNGLTVEKYLPMCEYTKKPCTFVFVAMGKHIKKQKGVKTMANDKTKVKIYEVYMSNASVIIPAVGCILFEDKLSFINASGNEVALFNFNEITGYKLLDITEV